ncbi:clathrin-adaptor medium chain AP-2 [Tieghemostelium lacteum]|uniref:Clathrin-adaptor medium chain AP-2 n=1 Tax=Tieghemostelium lacteum TaxID=361077 RepID=A0A151ZFR3_TIELA|nr:clathrin-adaptor medium chain AP-2 [Tieghemostelium lacteum]|eukprot:KYQ92704.1 clathrin-adaptor medium chain AP-2 [Tieghemostelium lacteum]
MISALFLMNSKGEVLISRIYRDDISRGVANAFRLEVIGSKETRSPVKLIGSTSFMYIKVGSIYLVGVSRQNVNACMVFEVLHQLVELFKSYFDNLDEDSIRNNFVLVYELLDEILDFGYPQNCSTDVLKLYITQGQGKLKSLDKLKQEKISKITIQATGTTPWRTPDIKYKKNELYIDVIESVNLLMSAEGNVLRADVSGQVMMKCHLSGMPECKFGMNDKILMDKERAGGQARTTRRGNGIEIDDITFHQCVKLTKFDTDRTISFIPPDGEFELMRYRTTEHINLPFKVIPIVREMGRTRLECSVTVKSNFSSKMFGTNVKVLIPTPKNTAVCKIVVAAGKAKYMPEQDAIVWRIKRFPGDTEFTLRAEVELMASVNLDKKTWSRPPISMEFQVTMFTASGFHVTFLKVIEKSNYTPIKWVRYLTKNGNYQMRI